MYRARAARIGALAALAALAMAACTDTEEPTPAAPATTAPSAPSSSSAPGTTGSVATTATEPVRTIEVTFAAGQVVGGARRETVRLGEKVRVRVTSDIADEVHIHTYDVSGAVAPGQPVELTFTASIPGRHEVELEKKDKQLLTLEVR